MLKQLSRQNAVRKKRKDRGQTLGLFLMALPMMIVVTIFSYIPMGGLIVAFKDYSYSDGLLKSPFSDPFWKNSTTAATSGSWCRRRRTKRPLTPWPKPGRPPGKS